MIRVFKTNKKNTVGFTIPFGVFAKNRLTVVLIFYFKMASPVNALKSLPDMPYPICVFHIILVKKGLAKPKINIG